ncbi:MAG: phosphatidate cytidylyltransferase [Methylophilaceae bacterium]|nr:phosphatidate cytidylyltransferase [Methylophilaceae bacterium]MDG1445454.1 phosphatidate cytidylyltransferase [Methylophilaceae bacterium]
MLRTRVITAVVLIAALLPALFFASNMLWAAIILAVSVAAIFEWAELIDLQKSMSVAVAVGSALLGAVLLRLMQKYGFHWLSYQALPIFVVSFMFWLLLAPILLAKRLVIQNKLLLMVIGFLVVVPLSLALIVVKSANAWLLLTLMAAIWVADSAAYFAGKQFGQRKLAPSISPGKTWEGVFGALIGVTLLAAILYGNDLLSNVPVFPLLWLVAVLGVIGDLFESLIKRQFNKKDSGNTLPGHGGILDRIDGLLPSLPIAVLVIYLFNCYQVPS